VDLAVTDGEIHLSHYRDASVRLREAPNLEAHRAYFAFQSAW
jgi:hypothetical protein